MTLLISLLLAGIVLTILSIGEKVERPAMVFTGVFVVIGGLFTSLVNKYAFLTYIIGLIFLTGWNALLSKH